MENKKISHKKLIRNFTNLSPIARFDSTIGEKSNSSSNNKNDFNCTSDDLIKNYPNSFNKNNYSFNKKKNQRKKILEKYLEKEELINRLIKIKKTMNNLNKEYLKQKIENIIQSNEIKRQNKLLNDIKSSDKIHSNSVLLGNNKVRKL